MSAFAVPRGYIPPPPVSTEWSDGAIGLVREYAMAHGEFMTEDIRTWAHDSKGYPHPSNPRAWGHVILTAKRKGIIRATGEYRMTRIPPAHPAPRNVWTGCNGLQPIVT